MNGFRFHDPAWLLALIPLAALGWFLVRRRRPAVLYSNVEILKSLPRTWALRLKRVVPWVFVLGLGLVVVALARPQKGLKARSPTEGIAIQMCIDRSGSMLAEDFHVDGERVNRLAAVKNVFHDFVAGTGGLPGRPNDLIGLISFGGFAVSQCPLTLDHGALLEVLETVEVPEPMVDRLGRILNAEELSTAIGDSLAVAVDRLKEVEAKSKIIILLSDGEQTAGAVTPEEGAEAAKAYGIKVYTVGVGTTGRAPFPFKTPWGETRYRSQQVVLDEKTLTMIAEKTGGRYFNARDAEAVEDDPEAKSLWDVYADIDAMERTTIEDPGYLEYRELGQYWLFPGLGLILVEMVLATTRFRSLP